MNSITLQNVSKSITFGKTLSNFGLDKLINPNKSSSDTIFESIKNNLLNDRNNFQLELDNLRTELNKGDIDLKEWKN